MPRILLTGPSDCEPRILPVPSGEDLRLGRDTDNDLRIEDGTISRHHARLLVGGGGACMIEDLGSANGTALNGGACITTPTALLDGDAVRFGGVSGTFLVDDLDVARLAPLELGVGDPFTGRYQIERWFGDTAEYRNFLATDRSARDLPISLRVFLPAIVADAGGFDYLLARFHHIRPATEHPHLVRLLDFSRWRGHYYVTAEWVAGFPLLDLLRHRGALKPLEVIRLARQAAAVTDHAHACGLPMPDLNPRAILLAFAAPLAAEDWQKLLDRPLDAWPEFGLKIVPRFFAPVDDPPAASVAPLGGLVLELFGHPPIGCGAEHRWRLAELDERGNLVLGRGVCAARATFGSDGAFIEALARTTTPERVDDFLTDRAPSGASHQPFSTP